MKYSVETPMCIYQMMYSSIHVSRKNTLSPTLTTQWGATLYVCMYVCQQVKSDLECRQINKVPVVRSQKVKGQGHRVTKSKNTWWTKLACIIGTVDDVSHSCHIGTVFFGSLCGNILSCEFYWWANRTCLLLLNRKFLPRSFSVRDFPIE